MITADRVKTAIESFQDDTGAQLLWQITGSRFGTPGTALRNLCQYIADMLNEPYQPIIVKVGPSS